MAAKYVDTITTRSGTAISGATVQALTGAGALVTLYSDDALSNPLGTSAASNDNGLVQFFIADGTYTIRQSAQGETVDVPNVELYDLSTIATTSDGAVANKAQASAVGISGSAANMGTTPGTILSDNGTAKDWFGESEAAIEARAKAAALFVSPMSYGAVGDGVTDDTAAVLAAMQSGRPVDGGGRTYATSGTMQPTSFAGWRDGDLSWLTPSTVGGAVLALVGISNFFIDNMKINVGSTTNTGSADDSGRNGLRVTSDNPGVSYAEGFKLSRVKVTGNGNGTRIQVRSAKRFTVDLCDAYDGTASYTPDPTNDIINGFDFKWCSGFTISNCNAWNLKSVASGTPTTKNTRGFLFAECQDFADINNSAWLVGQGCDYSGAITASEPIGNRGFTKLGGHYDDCYTYGVKFANVARSGRCDGVVVNRPGSIGIVVSSASVALTNPALNTSDLEISNYTVNDPTGSGGAYPNPQGVRIMQGVDVGWPRGVRFINGKTEDKQASPKMTYGAYSDVTYDGSSKKLNEVLNHKSVGHVTAAAGGFSKWLCSVKGTTTQSVANATQDAIRWDAEIIDTSAMHSTTVNEFNIVIAVTARYRCSFSITFAANSTGYRQVIVLKNGVAVAGGTFTAAAVNGAATVVSGLLEVTANAGDNFRIEVVQNSGGALNIDRVNSFFTVELVEAS